MFAVGRMEEATECRVSTLVSRFEQSNVYVSGRLAGRWGGSFNEKMIDWVIRKERECVLCRV